MCIMEEMKEMGFHVLGNGEFIFPVTQVMVPIYELPDKS